MIQPEEIYGVQSAITSHRNFSVQGLLKKMKVEVVRTTDDPVDCSGISSVHWCSRLQMKVLPAFRPDKSMAIADPSVLNQYLEKLGKSFQYIHWRFNQFLDVLKSRHDYFHSVGCRISDHGLERFYEVEWTERELQNIFEKVISGEKSPRASGNPKISIRPAPPICRMGFRKKMGSAISYRCFAK